MHISPEPDPHADNLEKTLRELLGQCEEQGQEAAEASARHVWVLLFCA